MATVGTYSIDDLYAVDDATVTDYGEDRVAEALQRDLQNFREQVEEMQMEVATFTTDRKARYGANQASEMVELDEFGEAASEKQRLAGEVAAPLKKFGKSIGWSREFMQTTTPKELAEQQVLVQTGYLKSIRSEIRNAIFGSANYTVRDKHVDQTDLTIRRLVNADSEPIPNGQNGETFDASTHTHYEGTGDFTPSDLEALIDDVVEHGHAEEMRVYINQGQEATIRDFGNFNAYVDARLYPEEGTPQETLDQSQRDDRAIGIFNGAEVWVKPWIPANYVFAFAAGSDEPVALRQHAQPALRGLRLAYEHDSAVLRADQYQAYMGAGVWERTNGAVLYTNGSTYSDPSFTA